MQSANLYKICLVVRITELSERKLAVLSAIVKAYIETGEPVGSKNLSYLMRNAPSSATLRNEMNALCTLGYLTQPHTSAGRIPTSLGYRLYIDTMMRPTALIDSAKEYINSQFADVGCDTQSIPKAAANALAALTGYPAISCYIVKEDVCLSQVRLLPVSRKTAVMLLIFSDGRTKSSICHIPEGLTAETNELFLKIVRSRFLNQPLDRFNKAYLQSIITSAGLNALSVAPLITNLTDMATEAAASSVEISGSASLYNFCNEEQARKIMSLANRATPMIDILQSSDKETNVIFGNDTDFDELRDKVLVISNYNCKGSFCGKIGIIGPDRMSYDRIIPSIQYIANKLTDLMTEAVNDMED